MGTARAVRTIPATAVKFSPINNGIMTKKRVAAYARVSTDKDEQQTSFDAQKDYYTKHIQSNPAWEFAGIFADEGLSGTSTKKRDGFNRMIADALDGKIDLIMTKSVSRFARNTVDSLTTVRKLKEKGVEIYFEKENIYTLDSKGELLISIMASISQEEVRNLSQNISWGRRKSFADGKVSLPYGQFLGYEKGEDGLPKIVEEEATIVRLIYRLFLEGKTFSGIARHLSETHIPTPAGKKKWRPSTVESILQNEKYKGDARLQKSFTVDFLTKKKKINEGELPQFYVEGSHTPIISSQVFDLVQHEFKKRKNVKGYKTGSGCFSGKIICGECGGYYGSKVWHSTSKYRRTIWQCNHKFKNEKKCQTPHLYEDVIKQAFLEAFNSLLDNKDEIIEGYMEIIDTLTDTSELDKESAKLQSRCEVVAELLHKCVDENARSALDQQEYLHRYTSLVERYEAAKGGLKNIDDKRLERNAKRESIGIFIKELEQRDIFMDEFDEGLWVATVDVVAVYSEHEITFTFKDGLELDWKI